MNDIPLIQKADINSINTSIIAIKKQLKQLNEALGLVDVPSIDTSVFVKKSDVVDVVEADNMNPVTSNAVATSNAMPVDTVTSGNMHSVTSNGVYSALITKANTQSHFDANTDKGTIANRIDAIKQFIPLTLAGIYRIRYAGGYYYSYIVIGNSSEQTILEINCYNSGSLCIFRRVVSTDNVYLAKTL